MVRPEQKQKPGRPATTRNQILDTLEWAHPEWVNFLDLKDLDGDVHSALFRLREDRMVEYRRLPQWGSGTEYRIKEG